MTLQIARGTLADVPETDALIHEAARWLVDKGEPLWGPNELAYDELLRVARAGELVTGRVSGQLAACMYLHNEDELFWPGKAPGEAFYIHRLAVARAFAGRGFSQAMLAWAAREARRRDRPYLRLDCEPRPKLLALYADAGFVRIDAEPITVIGHRVVRHEKRI